MELKLDSVLIGKILAGVIVVLAIVSAIVGAASTRSGGFDLFLYRLAGPLGIGFLIFMVTEVLAHLKGNSPSESGGEGSDDAA